MKEFDDKVSAAPKAVERLAPPEDVQRVAEQNSLISEKVRQEGLDLLARSGEMDMYDVCAEGQSYTDKCRRTEDRLKFNRTAITRAYNEVTKVFTGFENGISPDKEGTPAWDVKALCLNFLKGRLAFLDKEQCMLMEWAESEKAAIAADESLTEERRSAKIAKIDAEVLRRSSALQLMRPRTQTEVEITDRKAYKFIFEFWWTFLGMAMTKGELAKAMHPMIAFVTKMAGSVERLIADGVEYVEVPVLG